MSPNRLAIAAALASAVAAAVSLPVVAEAQGNMEKCYGIAKAGKNDCQTDHSSCAQTSKKDGQKDAWLTVPKGACEKIVGGSLSSG